MSKTVLFGVLSITIFLSLAQLSHEVDISEELSLSEVESHRNRRSNGDEIEISGQIILDPPPHAIPAKSRLKVEFLDARIADASSIMLGGTLVNVANYKNNTPLFYNMTVPRPKEHGHYSVSGVLNMGWKPAVGSTEWIRIGDYHTGTSHVVFVNITARIDKFAKNITLELYEHSAAPLALCDKALFKASLLVLIALFFHG